MALFRTKEEAVTAMQRWFWYVSGLEPPSTPGDVLLAFFEAIGFEAEQMSAGFAQALEEGVNAAAYSAFGLDFPEPATAQGSLTFSRATPATQNYLIPAGTRVQALNGEFAETTADATLTTGNTSVTVGARALRPGSLGNFPANTVTLLVNNVPGIESVTNPAPFTGGRDATAPEERQAAFQSYIKTLAKGTYGAIEQAALSATYGTERLSEARVQDYITNPNVPIGHVRLLAYRPGGVSLNLRLAVEQALEGDARAAGVFVEVVPVQEIQVNLNIDLYGSDGEAQTRAAVTVGKFFNDLLNGEDFFADRLQAALLEADPTLYRALITITAPTSTGGRVVVGENFRAAQGALNIFFYYGGPE